VSASVKDRLESVRATIEHAAAANGREAANITLIAVSKTIAVETIEEALAAGHRVFGENRVQEAKTKWPALKARFPDIELHLIGPLQTNKVRDALALFDAIHALDRESLAAALAKEIARASRQPKLFVEVNTGKEASKAGVAPAEADRFIETCRERHGLMISGLMCIPPLGEPAAPHFTLLAKIAERNGLPLLSMGMSADYEEAIAHGATHIRVGTAIFGTRG
jgi:pyridoxal phosphate enzyme (YggS family)